MLLWRSAKNSCCHTCAARPACLLDAAGRLPDQRMPTPSQACNLPDHRMPTSPHCHLQEEQRELAKTIRVSGSILLSTVSNFLDFFKIGE